MGGAGLTTKLAESAKLCWGMDSSLGFKVISTSRADANMDEEQLSDGASTGFEVQGSRKLFIYTRPFTQILIKTSHKFNI